jgi:hypothetical protein
MVAARAALRVIEIIAVRLQGGEAHQHITDVLWQSASSSGYTSRQALVEWLNASSENHAVVTAGLEYIPVLVVEPFDREPYVQTHSNGAWTGHLLVLPRF